MINRRTFALSAALSAVATALAAPAFARAPRTFRYAQTPGAAPDLQSLDLYPAPGQGARALRPLMVFIHGGGWRIGDKANPAHGLAKASFFNGQGMAFASLNYRLSPAVMHPAHVEDVAAALAWIADNAHAQGIDLQRIYLMGHSAGAHLAALVATDTRRLARYGKAPSMLRGVILLDGAGYDVATQAQAVIARGGFTGEMYSGAFGRDPAGWTDASPVHFVAPGHATPPFLIIRTQRPDAVRQTALLADALTQAGVDARVVVAPGYSHADVNRRIGQPGELVTDAIMDAVKRWG